MKAKKPSAAKRKTWYEWTLERVKLQDKPVWVDILRKEGRERVKNEGRGTGPFSAESAVDQALYKLVKAGKIVRVKRGWYAPPKDSEEKATKKKTSPKRIRNTFQVTHTQKESLKRLAAATGRKNKSEVIRDAVEFYEMIVYRIQMGEELFLGEDRNNLIQILTPQLSRVRKTKTPQ